MLPVTRLRVELEAAKRQGLRFEVAWALAVRTTRADSEWLAAFDASRAAFERAYRGEPATSTDRAALLLADSTTGLLDDQDNDLRECERDGCERRIKDRRPTALYCSRECCRLACHERERVC